MLIVSLIIILFGVFVSTPAIIFIWFFGWFVVCCGGFYCISKRPRAIHICNGITVGLIFGILAMVSFSIVRDIVNRPAYGPFDVTSIPDFKPQEGSIIYFDNGAPNISYIGEASYNEVEPCESNCLSTFFCVAPIIESSSFVINKSVVDYWVGCQVTEGNSNCQSQYFLESECFKSWREPFNSGFGYGDTGKIADNFFKAVIDSINKYNIIVSGGSYGNYSDYNPSVPIDAIVVLWCPNPEEEADIFWILGWILVISAPIVYCGYGLMYSAFCKNRLKREEYSSIK